MLPSSGKSTASRRGQKRHYPVSKSIRWTHTKVVWPHARTTFDRDTGLCFRRARTAEILSSRTPVATSLPTVSVPSADVCCMVDSWILAFGSACLQTGKRFHRSACIFQSADRCRRPGNRHDRCCSRSLTGEGLRDREHPLDGATRRAGLSQHWRIWWISSSCRCPAFRASGTTCCSPSCSATTPHRSPRATVTNRSR